MGRPFLEHLGGKKYNSILNKFETQSPLKHFSDIILVCDAKHTSRTRKRSYHTHSEVRTRDACAAAVAP